MRSRKNWIAYGFVGPTLVFLIAMNVFPLFYNLGLSFTDADLVGGDSRWVGGRNFGRVFTAPGFASAARTTGLFVFAAVSIELLLGFVVALALHRKFRGRMVVLILLLIPIINNNS